MARFLSILLLFVASMLVLHAGKQGAIAGDTTSTLLKAQGNHGTYGTTPGSLHPQECAPKCTYRCSATSYKKPCMFFCQKCCAKCLCVPSGTYGNKQTCPCYNNWKTKRGGPKCP
ncbi:protein GAST1-like [Mangifera indica]|uniref:protein GAST1-like n=1 Tax=Mangifera indica TaxID=29780 RepID=UPI001CFA5069|nr:protein GAST1-like [Mangifera indica]XP_044505304.1 protein GAST1-like [Mangifera indica]